jgi:glycosyltransferase involved in cell wall biosynthesis
VTSHPIQYQAPWFQALAREIDLKVFFAHRQDGAGQAAAGFGRPFEWDVPLLDGYAFEWLTNVSRHPSVETFAGCDTPSIAARLAGGRFDACLINGWYLKSYLQAIRACRRLDIPVLMRGDSHLGTRRSPILTAAKYLPYRWLLSRIDAHLYVGQANRRYLEHYGVAPERLFFAPHFVDNVRFAAAAARSRTEGAAAVLRARMGAAESTCVFIFAGKLIDKKRPQDFIDALVLLRARGVDAMGLLVGSGPLMPTLEACVAAAAAPVTCVGFRNQSEMPTCYAAADCLVLPSDGRETWGLVANEAMACGLPIVTSDAVGCREDLAREGAGVSYPMGDVAALAESLTRMVERLRRDPDGVRRAVTRRIAMYSCEAAVAGVREALAFTREAPSRAHPLQAATAAVARAGATPRAGDRGDRA